MKTTRFQISLSKAEGLIKLLSKQSSEPESNHLDDDLFIGYSMETLSSEKLQQAIEHLETCDVCAERMERFLEQSNAWQGKIGEHRLMILRNNLLPKLTNPPFARFTRYKHAVNLMGLVKELTGNVRQLFRLTAQMQRPAVWPDNWFSRLALLRKQTLALLLVIFLLLIVGIVAVGPQRVLAQMQALLGYVPGLGFVDLEEVRMLESPVVSTRDGMTFEIIQLIAQPDKTLVAFSIRGLSEITRNDLEASGFFNPQLILPDGNRIELTNMQYGGDESSVRGKITFPPIPPDVQQAVLVFGSFFDIPSGNFTEGWQIPFSLHPLENVQPTAESTDSSVLGEASVSSHGVTMEILQILRSPTETAIHLRFSWEEAGWIYSNFSIPMLKDNIGHIYHEVNLGTEGPSIEIEQETLVIESPTGTPTSPPYVNYLDESYVYPPMSSAARSITLSLPSLGFTVPTKASFTIDLGENPQVGQTWKIDQWIQVAGFDVYIPEVHLSEMMLPGKPSSELKEYLLKFIMQPMPRIDRSLISLEINSNSILFGGVSFTAASNTDPMYVAFEFSEMPKGEIELSFSEAEISIPGPWEISMDLPDSGEEKVEAKTLHPQTNKTSHGITVSITEVLLSDLMTLIKIVLPDLPPGAELVSVSPSALDEKISLEDETGKELKLLYDYDQGVVFGLFDPSELRFTSIFGSSRELFLYIPGVEVFYPGDASFFVDIPNNLSFHEEVIEEKSVEIGGEEHTFKYSRWFSDPWPVDLTAEIVGYSIHFNKARLERDENGFPHRYKLEIYADPVIDSSGIPHLSNLRVGSILRPDGEVKTFDYSTDPYGIWGDNYSQIGPKEPGSTEWIALLQFDVTSADRFNLLPGRYVINLDGALVVVPGPWRFNIPLEEQ